MFLKKNWALWLLAILITIGAAVYQRVTGPTYPFRGKVKIESLSIKYTLPRTHSGDDAQSVEIIVPDSLIQGDLVWKRFKTDDKNTYVKMERRGDTLLAFLPGQPPAGKLEYFVELEKHGKNYILPEKNSVVIRFKGRVPNGILIPHILAMFLAMLFSTRAGLEIISRSGKVKTYTYWTLGFLIFGGFIFGPLVQKFAFGELWTGVPFGWDLTDNKTLIALIGWLIVLAAYRKTKQPEKWAVFGAVVTFLIFLIPHSVLGSELDYKKLDQEKKMHKNKIEQIDNVKKELKKNEVH